MSSRAQILGLAQVLASNQCDPQTINDYYADLLIQLNQDPWLTAATLLPVSANQSSFNPPAGFVLLLGVAYDNFWLSPARLRELEWTDSHWRDRTGSPVAYVEEGETTRSFRLFPVPDQPSHFYSFVFGEPMGRDFPTYTVVLIHTETRDMLPDWLDLPVALSILARDFARESKYRDIAFAKMCGEASHMLLGMVK